MNWKVIRLELLRSPEFPRGSVARAYLLHLPLDPDGAIDTKALTKMPRRATVSRFWPSEPDQWGYATMEEGRLRLFGGRHRRYLSFGDKQPEVGRTAILTMADGRQLEFRISAIEAR